MSLWNIVSVIILWECFKFFVWLLSQLLGPVLNYLFGEWCDRKGIDLRDWYVRRRR